jgi:2-octaprenyl-3-methyl-6-methoxy-1,4-benzoquinol hydroxylase/2-octaprenylphenol hydroxylase
VSHPEFDIAVIGGGMVGAATACLLLRANFSVALVEAGDPPAYNPSAPVGLRVSAISPGSESILGHAGAWRIVAGRRHCPYRRMHVEEADGGEPTAIDFAAPEFGMERLGTIVENESVCEALWQVLEARKKAGDPLKIFTPARLVGLETRAGGIDLKLDSDQPLTARIVIGADGPRSRVRDLSGIDQKIWHYGQRGVVGVVGAERPNPGVAWQRFMDGGPLAFLPLNDGSSSIVWTRPEREADRLLKLDDEDFCDQLGAAAGKWLGDIKSCGPRAAFDLTMRLSKRYAAGRTVLVGDAAHVVHPLAGQGVNLGFLDAAALVELLVSAREANRDWAVDVELAPVLERYQRWRRSDAEVMARGIHGIRALFEPPLLAPIRRLGMRIVGRSWLAREAFLRRAAGVHPDAPQMARAEGP